MTIAMLIPAAGVGSRMQADRPKQYLTLANQTVLEHTAGKLLALPQTSRLFLALSPHDPYFDALPLAADARVCRVNGGAERADSVLAGLDAIDAALFPWTLVHDAARPLVQLSDIQQLIEICLSSGLGGILASPVRDTMKRGHVPGHGPSLVEHTVERRQLWHALTPQLFPTILLRDALRRALAAGVAITDEASAMEWAGHPVQLIAGRADNLKITQPEDLALARFYLEQA
ncbi:2-C-methyl-D-erythritol 4-phosphate cytidylyltransferase [Rheinheimera sp. F8]|uniref:2-C-methyl-D-erythritol 4-phosphate cytidylyltransferase n=1 Tax=Rheinheimera sp. F8 TaxID=1763998 RepID=UPI000744A885|nr:2-C-methyl-D-erythritol 4-phosphate cytidylyltransferase [Rheinheimera sp. F8]ALZ77095.1 2-C-methyl-D-erythritol 4-phosphate cytidylyltransferase [Rheinheimera sp. F8]